MRWRVLAVVLGLTSLFPSPPLGAAASTSNLEREKNWADEIIDLIMVGEPVWLYNRGQRFLGLYTPPARPGSTGIILLHGRGVHPAWGFIDHLRGDLAESGYHTLSLQLPILAADAPLGSYGPTLPEALERITVGVRYLHERKRVKRIILIGHSSGANTALSYAARHPGSSVIGVIAIGTPTYPSTTDLLRPSPQLRKLTVPVMDLSGGNDLQEVKSHDADRQAAARSAGLDFSLVEIPGADHFYTDHYVSLQRAILAWLRRFR